jgi:hypothetical protein
MMLWRGGEMMFWRGEEMMLWRFWDDALIEGGPLIDADDIGKGG